MFSSNPFPSSTNTFSTSSSFFAHEKENDNVDLNYHHGNHNPFISDDFPFQAYNSPAVRENVLQPQGLGFQYCEDQDDLRDSVISRYKKNMVNSKKDGHSKIYTAQGPRDRRVRLSIGIAKKFFCLQELLGFDKASKTLDWLLTKSLNSIKDLVEETNHCPSSIVSYQSKIKFLETITGGSDVEKGRKKKSLVQKCVDGKKKKTTRNCKDGIQEKLIRKQSRAQARARARERTKAKLYIN